jgi:hypothetical protein
MSVRCIDPSMLSCACAYASMFIANSLIVAFSIDCFLVAALLQRHNDQSPSTKSPSQAPTVTTIQKMIRGCDGAEYDYFGGALAVKGDWAAIGANGVSSSTGTVYLYKHDGNHWVFTQILTASDGSSLDQFGTSVAMSGNGHLVVAAWSGDGTARDTGAVYLYRLNSTSNTWGNEQKIVASDGVKDDRFGWSVAISETGHLAVGATGNFTGSVYLYKLDSTSNTWGDEQKIVPSDGARNKLFGDVVAMSETDHLVVGAPWDNDKGNGAGAVYLYRLVNSTTNTWGDEQKIFASDGVSNKFFGRAVAMSGTGHLVVAARVGTYWPAGPGSVYLYRLVNSTTNSWDFEQKIVASDGVSVDFDFFGRAIALSETGHLVVGAPASLYGLGSVFLYKLVNSTTNTWGDEQKIVASDGAQYDAFGHAVAMSETGRLVVGAFGDDDKGSKSGAVYAIGEGVCVSLFAAHVRSGCSFSHSKILTCLSIRWLLILREETLLNLKRTAQQQQQLLPLLQQ